MRSPNINTNIDGFQAHGEWAEIPLAPRAMDQPVIGQFLRPEDQRPWHMLSIEGFGVYAVQANTIDAAWLKLSYLAQDTDQVDPTCAGTSPDYNPETQLDMFLSAESLPYQLSLAYNRIHPTHSVVMKGLSEYNPSPAKRWPEHVDWIRTQGDRQLKAEQAANNVISLAAVVEARKTTYPNVA